MIATSFQSGGVEYTLTRAEIRHVEALIDLLADDPIGSTRETTNPEARTIYEDAFKRIDEDPAQLLVTVLGRRRGSRHNAIDLHPRHEPDGCDATADRSCSRPRGLPK